MALLLSIQNPYDGLATDCYHKIIETNINWLNKSAHVTLASYLNQDARLELKQPIASFSFDWAGDDFPFTLEALDLEGNNVIKLAYQKIKQTEKFSEAEDV